MSRPPIEMPPEGIDPEASRGNRLAYGIVAATAAVWLVVLLVLMVTACCGGAA